MKNNDHKIFDGDCMGVNQLIDSPHAQAIALWKKGVANNWTPQAVNMSDDVKQWKQKDFITADEKLLVKRTLGLFAAGESLVSNSVMLAEYRYVTDGAMRQYMIRKLFEESLHNFTIAVCCEAYGLDVKEVAEAYLSIPSIRKKDKFLEHSLSSFDANFSTKSKEGKQKFTRNVFVFYMICEGTWFYPNFAMILAMGRQNKLRGLCDQIAYTLKDESCHLEFGVYLLDVIKKQYPEIWTDKFREELTDLMKQAVDIEIDYCHDILPRGILGVNSQMLIDYTKYIANRRLESVGLEYRFDSDKNPFPWLAEAQDAETMTAFFEVRNKTYQNSSALVDDL